MVPTLVAAIAEQLGTNPPKRLGVAVSGGGDSVALLSALVRYTEKADVELHVITVDHGLRDGAKTETALVTDLCTRWSLPHHVEFWNGWVGEGNLQAAAREARYALMTDWAYSNQISHIALGHTADDQAETFLMRLARGSGVDGLSAMSPRRVQQGVTWVRPFLSIERTALRSYLRAARIDWCEDPSNEDRSFDRVRVRDALTVLGTLGLNAATLVDVAGNMAKARDALQWQTFLAAQDCATIVQGSVAIEQRSYRILPEEIARRLLVHAVSWIASSPYPPRRDTVARALQAMREGRTVTLAGCQVEVQNGVIWIFRELHAVLDQISEVGDLWDNRWVITGPEDDPEFEVRSLGFEALAWFENWREIGLPRAALAAAPAVWYGEELIAAPVIQEDEDWAAELDSGQDAFFAALLSH